MPFKVAVGSSDKKTVNVHFGKCKEFLIYETDETGTYKLTETRKTEPVCNFGTHDDIELKYVIDMLADCKYVLVSRVGPGCEKALSDRGIQSFGIEDNIDKAMLKLAKYDQKYVLKSKVTISGNTNNTVNDR
jgi:predicted Fe-Mo cluster-binding NifX family protein